MKEMKPLSLHETYFLPGRARRIVEYQYSRQDGPRSSDDEIMELVQLDGFPKVSGRYAKFGDNYKNRAGDVSSTLDQSKLDPTTRAILMTLPAHVLNVLGLQKDTPSR